MSHVFSRALEQIPEYIDVAECCITGTVTSIDHNEVAGTGRPVVSFSIRTDNPVQIRQQDGTYIDQVVKNYHNCVLFNEAAKYWLSQLWIGDRVRFTGQMLVKRYAMRDYPTIMQTKVESQSVNPTDLVVVTIGPRRNQVTQRDANGRPMTQAQRPQQQQPQRAQQPAPQQMPLRQQQPAPQPAPQPEPQAQYEPDAFNADMPVDNGYIPADENVPF